MTRQECFYFTYKVMWNHDYLSPHKSLVTEFDRWSQDRCTHGFTSEEHFQRSIFIDGNRVVGGISLLSYHSTQFYFNFILLQILSNYCGNHTIDWCGLKKAYADSFVMYRVKINFAKNKKKKSSKLNQI